MKAQSARATDSARRARLHRALDKALDRKAARDASPSLRPGVAFPVEGGTLKLLDGEIQAKPDNKGLPTKTFASDREAMAYLRNCAAAKDAVPADCLDVGVLPV
jgi:hypothetical protein